MTGFAPPLVDFSPLARLATTYREELDRSTTRGIMQRAASANGELDFSRLGRDLIGAGQLEAGTNLYRLGAEERRLAQETQAMQGLAQQFGTMFGGQPPAAAPGGVAPAAGGASAPNPGGYLGALRAQESGGDPNARNSRSSATGIYQFTEPTWARLVNSPEGRAAGLTLEGIRDPRQQEAAIPIFTSANARALQAAGHAPTPGNLYMAHFLGRGGGPAFLSAMQTNPDAPAISAVGTGVARANPTIFFDPSGRPRTMREVYALQTRRFGGDTMPPDAAVASAPLGPVAPGAPAPVQVASTDPSVGVPPMAAPVAGRQNVPGTVLTQQDIDQIRRVDPQGPAAAGAPPAMPAQVAAAPAAAPVAAPGAVPGAIPTPPERPAPASMPNTPQTIATSNIGPLYLAAINPRLSQGAREASRILLQSALHNTQMTDEQKEYVMARSQGETATFTDWSTARRRAGSTTVTQSVDQRGENAEAVAQANARVARFTPLANDEQQARQDMFIAQRFAQALNQVEPGARTVALDTLRRRFGLNLDPNADNVQAVGSFVNYMIPRMRPPGSGPQTDADAEMFRQALPGLTGTPGGNEIAIRTVGAVIQFRVRQAQVGSDYINGSLTAAAATERLRALGDPYEEFTRWQEQNARREGGGATPRQTAPPRGTSAPAPAPAAPQPASPAAVGGARIISVEPIQ